MLAELCLIIAENQGDILNLRLAKRTVDFFDMIFDIEVADGDEGRPVRAVVGVIEFHEPFARRGADDVQIADREAVGQALAGRPEGQIPQDQPNELR